MQAPKPITKAEQSAMELFRTCKTCGDEYPIDHFQKHPTSKNGRISHCRHCWAAYIRERSHTDYAKGLRRKHSQRDFKRDRASRYGLTLQEYEARVTAQNGVCAICGKANKSGRALHIDHDHKTGKVRALLCANCNRGLGCFGDDPSLLRSAIEYLEKSVAHPSSEIA